MRRRDFLTGVLVTTAGSALSKKGSFIGSEPVSTKSLADTLLAGLTIDEKVSLVHGAVDPRPLGQAGYLPGVPRLGIPEVRLVDGPVGIVLTATATAPPAPVSLASTFSADHAHQLGVLLGREARANGQDVVLGPHVNLVRVPRAIRNRDTFGEDPFLAGLLAAAETRGIRAQGVLAAVKHFVANNQALGQAGQETFDFRVDQRTLHELYLPAFEAAAGAGAAAVMAAYNHINGEWNSENPATLNDVLRTELGFTGFVMSDWGATHSTTAIERGLDVEMPNGTFFGSPLKDAVQSGRIPMATLDRAVRRLLGQLESHGLLDGSRVPAAEPQGHRDVVRGIAVNGAVLLANDGVLPLSAKAVASLGLIGATAAQLAVGSGDERAMGELDRLVSPLQALRQVSGNSAIKHAVGFDVTGVAVPAEALYPGPDAPVSRGLTWRASDGTGGVDATVDFVGSRALPTGKNYTWTGSLRVARTGTYELNIQSAGGSGELRLDGVLLTTSGLGRGNTPRPRPCSSLLPTTDGMDNGRSTVELTAGTEHEVEIAGKPGAGTPLQIRFAWVDPVKRQSDVDAAVALAAKVDTAVVFAFNDAGSSRTRESRDRPSLALPHDQDALITAVAAANPNTVVVLNTGDPITMPWRDKVRAVLQMWYPGQEGGWATADLLLGKSNPSGKLPVTFPCSDADTPAAAARERYEGVGNVVTYSEGIFMGYRWYDSQRITPLFPFGHGLSYTRFEYSDLAVTAANGGLQVSFTVRNTGSRAGTEIAQVYLGAPAAAPVPMAERTLGAVARAELAAGASKRLTAFVAPRQLSYWNGRWTVATGQRELSVGASSRDLRLSKTVTV